MKLTSMFVALACPLILSLSLATAGNPNPGAAPRKSKPHGKSYSEWAESYRLWLSGIPAEFNPSLDETGDHCGEEQSGHLWYLASAPPGSVVERTCHIPGGTGLYVPLIGAFVWGVEDAGFFAFLMGLFGGPDTEGLNEEEIMSAFAAWLMDGVTHLGLTVAGVPYQGLYSYRASADAFDIYDLDLYADQSPMIPDVAVTDGFAVILHPLSAGEHTIEISAEITHPLFGPNPVPIFVTYHLTVGP